MALRPSGFRRENSIVSILVGLSVVAYIFTGNEGYMTISATLFWVSLLLFAGRKVEVGNGKIVLKWGWPVVITRKEIQLHEVRDVIDISEASEVRLIQYFKEMILFALLWVSVGVFGLLKGSYSKGSYLWVAWIFWGLYPLFLFASNPKNKKRLTFAVISLGIFLGVLLAYLGQGGMGLYMAGVGIVVGGMTYDGVLTLKGILLITDKEHYLLTTYDEKDVKKFLEKLGAMVLSLETPLLSQKEGLSSEF